MPAQHPDRLLHLNREWCLQTDSGSTLCTLGRLQQSTPASLFIIHAEGTYLPLQPDHHQGWSTGSATISHL